MPPNEDVLNAALDDLRETELLSFSADPTEIRPFGESVLQWEVRAPSGVRVLLNGQQVALRSESTVRPVETRNYVLTATAPGGLRSTLGQATVSVDTSACIADTISEAEVVQQVTAVINRMLAEDDKIRERRPPEIEVTSAGIVLKLRFEIDLNNKPDPDFNIDALVGVRVDEDGLVAFFRSFEADLDFSFWEDVLIFSIGSVVGGPFLHLAIALAESNAQSESQRKILDGIQGALDLAGLLVPDGWQPHRVEFREGEVDVWRCPRPGSTIATFADLDFTFSPVGSG